MFRKILVYLSFCCVFSLLFCACSVLGSYSPTPTYVQTQAVQATAFPRVTPKSPTPTTDVQPACQLKKGRLTNGEIETPLLYKPMRYIVYLPPCYDFDADKHYPVLYLFHGQGFTEDQWVRMGVNTTADQLISSGKIPPFLIVMPFDYAYKQPTEYAFEDVFLHQLIPAIETNYRVLRGREYRALGGLSRGGAWALHIGMRNPALFASIGGHSASIFVVDEKVLRSKTLAVPAQGVPRIWLDAGDADSELGVIGSYEQFLTENHIPHEWHVYVGWHDEKYWSSHLEGYLFWYTQVWK